MYFRLNLADGESPWKVGNHARLHSFKYDEGGYWKGVLVGMCALWSVVEPSQNGKTKARADKTEGGNEVSLLEHDDQATGEELPVNAPQLTKK